MRERGRHVLPSTTCLPLLRKRKRADIMDLRAVLVWIPWPYDKGALLFVLQHRWLSWQSQASCLRGCGSEHLETAILLRKEETLLAFRDWMYKTCFAVEQQHAERIFSAFTSSFHAGDRFTRYSLAQQVLISGQGTAAWPLAANRDVKMMSMPLAASYCEPPSRFLSFHQ